MKNKSLYLLLFLLISISSCTIETAKKDTNQQLIIFSDCLTKEDVKLFSKFQKTENITLSIQKFNTDTLLSKIEREGYNCKADVIILNSMYSIQKILYK